MVKKKIVKRGVKKREKVCEIFEVGKKGKEKLEKGCGTIPIEHAGKKEISKENKILRNILIAVGVIMVILIVGVLITNSMKNPTYKGVKFKLVQEGQLLVYNTKLPVLDKDDNKVADYNFYLRINPNKNDVPFIGDFSLKKTVVLNSTSDFNCGGMGIIGVANMITLFNFFKVEVIKDENATCDPAGRYTYIYLKEADKSSIEQVGNSCYDFNIANCEALEVTEKMMLENLADFQNG